jgi:predicted Zn finger-like uncharacterized protein
MVITVTCPSCASSFPVDPAKIPEGGVNGRCSSCAGVFRIEKPEETAPVPVVEFVEPEIKALEPPIETPQPAVEAPEPAFAAEEPAFEAPAPGYEAPEPAAAGPVEGLTFGKQDPMDKTKRLARALVSDMIMYNAERHQSALETGTLVQDFEEEIDKSWKEFVDQVGDELASGPGQQFWIEALNDILAKGEQVF